MSSFPARYRSPNPCKVCGKHIEVGEQLVWSRRNRGVFYHGTCYNELKAGGEVVESKDAFAPTTIKVESTPAVADVANLLSKPYTPKPVQHTHRKEVINSNSSWDKQLDAVLPATSRILLVGPPSSGKSTTAMILAGTKHRITMTETTSREDLIGMFHLIAGETKWVDGPVTTAMRNGEAVLFDEVDRYSPECASLFYSIIDDKPHISLPTGELVEANEGYKVIMTTNETLETLPPAVQDRIEVIINASYPHEAVIADLPKHAQHVVLRYYKAQAVKDLTLPPTVRRMKCFNRLLAIGVPSDVSAELVFGNRGGREILSALTSAESNY